MRNFIAICLLLFPFLASVAWDWKPIHPRVPPEPEGECYYQPVLKIGRVWKALYNEVGTSFDEHITYEYRVEKDTLIDNVVFYVIKLSIIHYYEDHDPIETIVYKIVNEEKGKLIQYYSYKENDNTMSKYEFVVFSVYFKEGDVLHISPWNPLIVHEDTVMVMGQKRRCLHLVPDSRVNPILDGFQTDSYWIEGLGFLDDYYVSWQAKEFYNTAFDSIKLMSVYDGDTCIFDREQFDPTPLGVERVNAETPSRPPLYFSIDGRRLPNSNGARMMIKDGKKYMMK